MAIGISAIRVRGFRSHVDTYVKLTPIGLNVVTGKTDSGKTALTIQAIRWVALAEPDGEEFLYTRKNEAGEIIEQAEEVYVALELSTGVTVEKTRRKGKTKYKLSTIPEPFEQAAVPEEVKAALGIRKKHFGDFEVDINFAYQLGSPWLISETPSAGAKVLGTLAGTEAVDAAFKGVGKDQYAARTERQNSDKEAQQKEKDLQQYADLDTLKEQFSVCEYLLGEAEVAADKRESLQGLYERWYFMSDILRHTNEELDRLAIVPELALDMENIQLAQQRYERLLDLYERKAGLDHRINLLDQELGKYEALPLAVAYLEEAESNQAKVETLTKLSTLHTGYSQELRRTTEILEKTKDLDILTEELKQLEELSVRLEKLKGLAARYDLAKGQVERHAVALELTKGIGQAAELLQQAVASQERVSKLYELDNRHEVKLQTLRKAASGEITASADAERFRKELAAAWEATGEFARYANSP
ncbi:MAG: AAA family ATPase [Desulfosporosinus sp.]|nr:AAA family ATPase [Desulfosporosinus sp.]